MEKTDWWSYIVVSYLGNIDSTLVTKTPSIRAEKRKMTRSVIFQKDEIVGKKKKILIYKAAIDGGKT